MKRNTIKLSRRYVTALRKHLKQGPRASLRPAGQLGRQAAAARYAISAGIIESGVQFTIA